MAPPRLILFVVATAITTLATSVVSATANPLSTGLRAASVGDARACVDAMRQTLRQSSKPGRERATAWYWLARCARSAGDLTLARGAARRLANRYPDTFHALMLTRPPVNGTLRCRWVLAAIEEIESKGKTDAISHKGARGAMQILPTTARRLLDEAGLDPESWPAYLDDRRGSWWLAQRYLARELPRLDGDLIAGLVAYNAGPGRARRWLKARVAYDPVLAIDQIPYYETREYVRRFVEAAWRGNGTCNGSRLLLRLAFGKWPSTRNAR